MKKSELIQELAKKADISKTAAASALEALAVIAYRETKNGFTIPGLCKLKLVRKKESKRRNPATGDTLLVGEHDVVKIQPLKKAKETIAPRPADLVKVLPPEPRKEKPAAPAPTPETPVTPIMDSDASVDLEAPPKQEKREPIRHSDDDVVFSCPDCGETIVLAGGITQPVATCPSCMAEIDVSALSGDAPRPQGSDAQTPHPDSKEEFITFVCQSCGQEIEAPVDMMGLEADCPACGTIISVMDGADAPAPEPEGAEKGVTPPDGKELSSMTIRIDLSDLS